MEIDNKDLVYETFTYASVTRSMTSIESAVRLTHMPTGESVEVNISLSRHKNREKALEIIKKRLTDHKTNIQ